MQVNVKQFLEEAGITEALYPGKRLVHTCRQPGDFKSHCVVFDWRNPEKIRVEVKAGLSGRDLEPKKLKYYPVSFQTPTYVDIEFINDNKDKDDDKEEEEGKSSSSGKSSGGGKQPKKTLDDIRLMASEAFDNVKEGKVPSLGKIVEMVVLGTKIATEKFGAVMQTLAHGISHAKVSTTDMLAHAGKYVTKYEPPSFMKPTGDEEAKYKYDREKNADISFKSSLG